MLGPEGPGHVDTLTVRRGLRGPALPCAHVEAISSGWQPRGGIEGPLSGALLSLYSQKKPRTVTSRLRHLPSLVSGHLRCVAGLLCLKQGQVHPLLRAPRGTWDGLRLENTCPTLVSPVASGSWVESETQCVATAPNCQFSHESSLAISAALGMAAKI